MTDARSRTAAILGALRRPDALVMLALGFASGLPFLLIGSTLSYWLGDAHVGLAMIGFLSWVGLTYSLKFVWAAVADNLAPPLLERFGKRRGWLIWAQLGVMTGLAGMAASEPRTRMAALAGFALLTALSAATQDVVIDALRIEQARDAAELDLLTSAYQLGYRVANIATASVILLMANAWGWRLSYAVFAAAMGVGVIATLFAREPVGVETRRTATAGTIGRWAGAVTGPFAAFLRTFGPATLLILSTVSAYELCDYVRGPVISPFYVAVGLPKTMVAATRLTVGLPLSILGTAAGGLFAARFGHMRTLVLGAVLQPLAVASFALLVQTGPSAGVFAGLMAIDDFSMSFAGVALLAYMSTLTSPGYTATQFALLTSAVAWSGKLLKGFSGVWVQRLARPGGDMAGACGRFFILEAAICGGLAMILLLALAALRVKPSSPPLAHAGSTKRGGR